MKQLILDIIEDYAMTFASLAKPPIVVMIDSMFPDGILGCLSKIGPEHRTRVAFHHRLLVDTSSRLFPERGDTIVGGQFPGRSDVPEVVRIGNHS